MKIKILLFLLIGHFSSGFCAEAGRPKDINRKENVAVDSSQEVAAGKPTKKRYSTIIKMLIVPKLYFLDYKDLAKVQKTTNLKNFPESLYFADEPFVQILFKDDYSEHKISKKRNNNNLNYNYRDYGFYFFSRGNKEHSFEPMSVPRFLPLSYFVNDDDKVEFPNAKCICHQKNWNLKANRFINPECIDKLYRLSITKEVSEYRAQRIRCQIERERKAFFLEQT